MQYPLFFLVALFFSLASASTFTNPLKPENGADPFIVYVESPDNCTEGYYYLLNTASHGYIEMIRSHSLEGLKTGERKNVWSDNTTSRCCDLWAPEIHELNGTWYMYYSAAANNSVNHRLYVLKGGSSPWDEYSYLGQLDESWGIDGSIIHFPNHGHYFIWACLLIPGLPQSTLNHEAICIAPLLSPSEIGERRIISSPTEPWERHGQPVNEGPHALYHDDKIFITFSASNCGTAFYSLGLLAWSGENPSAITSWTKTGPVLSSANGNYGTGHNGFFRSPDGTEIWNVFHAEDQYPQGACNGSRYTMVERVYFNDTDGSPSFEMAMKLSLKQTAPSGEGTTNGLAAKHEPPQN